MKDATVEAPKTEKVKKETSLACTIKLVDIKYGVDQTCFDLTFKRESKLESEDRLLNYAYDKRNEMVNNNL